MIAPGDRCDLCHEPAELDDSDLALVACCEAGPRPRCGERWMVSAGQWPCCSLRWRYSDASE